MYSGFNNECTLHTLISHAAHLRETFRFKRPGGINTYRYFLPSTVKETKITNFSLQL